MSKDKLIQWQNPKGDVNPDDEKKETFKQVVSRAYAKKRDGESLTDKEKWALKNASKQPKLVSVTGPRRATLENIEKIVKMQIEEGLSYAEIAEKLGKKPTTIAHLIGRHDREYRRALQKVADEAVKDAGVRRPVVWSRMLALYQRAALRAPLVMEELMDDPMQPGGVRAKAAQDAMDRFDMGKDATQAKIAAQTPNPEALQVIKDTIGIMERIKRLSEPSEVKTYTELDAGHIIIEQAEVVDETPSD